MTKQRPKLVPVIIGTGFGSGFFPWGPGTAGALLATVLWYLLSLCLSSSWLVLATVLLVLVFTVAGVWSADRLEPFWGEDPSRVVVDEMVGVWLALLACPAGSVGYAFLAFLLFRFFDILKPFGVRHMEKMGGGVGVMMDDVLAGLYAMLVVYVVRFSLIPICDF